MQWILGVLGSTFDDCPFPEFLVIRRFMEEREARERGRFLLLIPSHAHSCNSTLTYRGTIIKVWR